MGCIWIASNIWSCCADVCSSNIYQRHFSPERRIESKIITEKQAISCKLLSLTHFEGTSKQKCAVKRFQASFFPPLPLLPCCFLCKTAVFIYRQPLFMLISSFIWFELGSGETHTDAIIIIANTHRQPLCVELHKSVANSSVNILF